MKRIFLLGALLVAGSVIADEFTEATKVLCEKMKQCALEQMGGENIPPGMKDMMMQSMDAACASMQQQYNYALTQHELYKPAIACMKSLQGMSCAALQEDARQTPECKKYEKQLEAYED